MTVERIVTSVTTGSVQEVSRFCADLFDLTVVMDQGQAPTLTEEPWGVRRFFLRDPAGKLINVMSHIDKARAHSTVQPDTVSGSSHN